MRLGLLGIDSRTLEVVSAARGRGDRVVIGCDLPAEQALRGHEPHELRRIPSWESLLDPASCDAVVVGADGWNESRAEGVRMLVQAGRPLLLSHPLELSMLWAYELDMIRRDTGGQLVPLLPDRLHPFVGRLRQAIEAALAGSGPLAAPESITLIRRMHDRRRDQVLAQLACDADLVRVLAGDPARLATLGASDLDAAWSTLAVGFTGPSQVPVRWQVVPGDPQGLTISLQHAAGSLDVTAPDDPALPWTWSGPPADSATFDRGAAMLGVLHAALDTQAVPRPDDAVAPASWADAARAIELAETVPRSLARGRAIDLHQEEFSEIGTFRGTMASLGCGLVLAALVVLVLATLVGGMANEFGWDFGKNVAAAWPVLVLAVLGLFLALQFLPMLAGIDRRPGSPGGRLE
jgi:predicted dehydrogenase